MPDELDGKLSLRVCQASYDKFEATCEKVHGRKPLGLLRELIDAVNDGRVTITPTKEQLKEIKQTTELYNVT